MKSLLFTILIIIPLIACANNNYLNNPEYIEAQNGNVDAQYNIAMNYLNEIDGFPKDNRSLAKVLIASLFGHSALGYVSPFESEATYYDKINPLGQVA